MCHYKPTETALRILDEIDRAGSAVVTTGKFCRLLAGGEFIKCMPDVPLRLVAFGYLCANGDGRLTLSGTGRVAIDTFRSSRKYQREEVV